MSEKSFPFFLVDAFTNSALGGNPCSVVFNAESLTAEEMLKIAKEMNQSETAFVMRSKISDLKARYFTPEREIPLAGHPTIATIHAALKSGWLKTEKPELSLELNDGPIKVGIENLEKKLFIKMYQRKPQFFETHDKEVVAKIFGLSTSDLEPAVPIQTVSTGTKQLMIAVRSHEVLRKIEMNVNAYRTYREKMNFFSPHLFCLGGATSEGDTFARHPGVPPDTSEDAFTGSATGGMAAFLFHHGLMKKNNFTAEQGHWMGRPGKALVEIIGQPSSIESIVVGGEAVITVSGTLNL